MAAAIKELVSKNKIRYKEDGFDLDLSYISKNIIAMGFPAETLERFYRNHIDEVVKFFDTKHSKHYRIYNLCSERKRRYDVKKFHGEVNVEYSFQDHNPPPFQILKPFCESVTTWLKAHPKNVAGIHCKAGKGRTGVMICAYLIHSGHFEHEDGQVITFDAETALEFYARHRTSDLKGVTIPSQRRYVYYYEELVKRQHDYRLIPLKLTSVILSSVPFNNGGSYTLGCEIYTVQPKTKIRSFNMEVKKGSKHVIYTLPDELRLIGDIKFEFYMRKMTKDKIFQFWLNTFFVGLGIDLPTLAADHCSGPGCDGWLVSKVSASPDNASVIDYSFLKLTNSTSDKPFKFCDCNHSSTSNSNPAAFSLNSKSTAPHSSSNDTGIHNPSSSLPSTSNSSLIHENNKSTISSHSSSSSLHSLNQKMNNLDLQPCKPPPSDREFYVIFPKEKIDKAYKDKSHKTYSADFNVILHFTSLGLEMQPNSKPTAAENVNCTEESSSSENDSENEEDSDEENFDLANSPAVERNDDDSSAQLNSKKGETTHL